MEKIRLLTKDEIECRVEQVAKDLTWCNVLLYKDARVDMRILDEVFGQMNWQRHHELINGNLFCTVSVWDKEKNAWVSKQDVGVESMTEKEKGQASDAFKRACFNIGIGRELYTAPTIFINLTKADVSASNKVKARFKVADIGYTNGEITSLVIVDDKGLERYRLRPKAVAQPKANAIELALEQIRQAKTTAELAAIYRNNQSLQADEKFISNLTQRKKEIAQ